MSGLRRYRKLDITEQLLKNLVIAQPVGKVLIQGFEVDVNTDRYLHFYHNGLTCVKCGLTASFAAIEKDAMNKRKCYINFYGVDENKEEIVMTRDHIYPRALGGFDDIKNYQTLCLKCNNNKKDKTELTLEEAIEKGYTNKERAAAALEIKKEYDKYQELLSIAAKQKKVVDELKKKYIDILPPRDKSEFLDR